MSTGQHMRYTRLSGTPFEDSTVLELEVTSVRCAYAVIVSRSQTPFRRGLPGEMGSGVRPLMSLCAA